MTSFGSTITIEEYNQSLNSVIEEIEKYPNAGGDMFYGDAQEEIRKIMICERCGNKGIEEISTTWPELKGKFLCDNCLDKAKDEISTKERGSKE